MADRVASDNPSVRSLRASIVRAGSTRRPRLLLRDDADVRRADGIVRLVVDGDERFAPTADSADGIRIEGAFDSPRLARERGGRNRLVKWVGDTDLDFGRSVTVDIVIPGYKFGVRVPGERVVYEATEPPSGGLREIAEALEDDT